MDPKTTSLVAAAAALTAAPALAATPPAPAPLVATSYAELLQPVPNALERLRAADAEDAANPAPRLIRVQGVAHHHHHHHHHHHSRRWYRAHGYVFLNGAWVVRPVAHHHHHHHHHHHNNN